MRQGGHLNAESGYVQFPNLLERMERGWSKAA